MIFFLVEGMTHNVRFTFSVSDTTWAVYNHYEARQIELVTPDTTFSVSLVRERYRDENI